MRRRPAECAPDTLNAAARDVLRRLHAACDGDLDCEVSFSTAAADTGLDYLATRGVLGVMLERRWIVRHGRDAVTLTTDGVDEAVRTVAVGG